MDWHTDGPGLVGNASGDGLANPPGSVGGELVSLTVLEFLHSLDETNVTLLHQVKELETAVGIFLGDGYHQSEVGIDEPVLCLLHHVAAAVDFL